jgi:hypothetical protein
MLAQSYLLPIADGAVSVADAGAGPEAVPVVVGKVFLTILLFLFLGGVKPSDLSRLKLNYL